MDLIQTSIQDLEHPDRSKDAYLAIIRIGKPAIPHLIANFANTNSFDVDIATSPVSSFRPEDVTVGLISLYLVDCIVSGEEHPHLSPIIRKTTPYAPGRIPIRTEEDVLRKAAVYYSLWWVTWRSADWEKAEIPLPLKGKDLMWD
jgi:hypothetical protein